MSALALFVFDFSIALNLISMFSPSSFIIFKNLSSKILTYTYLLCQEFFLDFKGFEISYRLIFKYFFIFRKVWLFFLFHQIKLLSDLLPSFSISSYRRQLREYLFSLHCPVPESPASEPVPYSRLISTRLL